MTAVHVNTKKLDNCYQRNPMVSPNFSDPNELNRIAVAAVMAGGPFAEFDDSRKIRFLTVFALTGHLRKSADSAHVCVRTPHQWRTNDPEFRAAYEQAKDIALEMVESEMFNRAINGVERIKLHPKTGEPYVERHWPESTAQFLLKTRAEYRDKTPEFQNNGGQETNVAAIIAEIKREVPDWEEACDKELLDAYEEDVAKAQAKLIESNGNSVLDVQATNHEGNGASY